MSKVVRAIIEANGNDGARLKSEGRLFANYRKGYVKWDREMAAEWKGEPAAMVFTAHGRAFEGGALRVTNECQRAVCNLCHHPSRISNIMS